MINKFEKWINKQNNRDISSNMLRRWFEKLNSDEIVKAVNLLAKQDRYLEISYIAYLCKRKNLLEIYSIIKSEYLNRFVEQMDDSNVDDCNLFIRIAIICQDYYGHLGFTVSSLLEKEKKIQIFEPSIYYDTVSDSSFYNVFLILFKLLEECDDVEEEIKSKHLAMLYRAYYASHGSVREKYNDIDEQYWDCIKKFLLNRIYRHNSFEFLLYFTYLFVNVDIYEIIGVSYNEIAEYILKNCNNNYWAIQFLKKSFFSQYVSDDESLLKNDLEKKKEIFYAWRRFLNSYFDIVHLGTNEIKAYISVQELKYTVDNPNYNNLCKTLKETGYPNDDKIRTNLRVEFNKVIRNTAIYAPQKLMELLEKHYSLNNSVIRHHELLLFNVAKYHYNTYELISEMLKYYSINEIILIYLNCDIHNSIGIIDFINTISLLAGNDFVIGNTPLVDVYMKFQLNEGRVLLSDRFNTECKINNCTDLETKYSENLRFIISDYNSYKKELTGNIINIVEINNGSIPYLLERQSKFDRIISMLRTIAETHSFNDDIKKIILENSIYLDMEPNIIKPSPHVDKEYYKELNGYYLEFSKKFLDCVLSLADYPEVLFEFIRFINSNSKALNPCSANPFGKDVIDMTYKFDATLNDYKHKFFKMVNNSKLTTEQIFYVYMNSLFKKIVSFSSLLGLLYTRKFGKQKLFGEIVIDKELPEIANSLYCGKIIWHDKEENTFTIKPYTFYENTKTKSVFKLEQNSFYKVNYYYYFKIYSYNVETNVFTVSNASTLKNIAKVFPLESLYCALKSICYFDMNYNMKLIEKVVHKEFPKEVYDTNWFHQLFKKIITTNISNPKLLHKYLILLSDINIYASNYDDNNYAFYSDLVPLFENLLTKINRKEVLDDIIYIYFNTPLRCVYSINKLLSDLLKYTISVPDYFSNYVIFVENERMLGIKGEKIEFVQQKKRENSLITAHIVGYDDSNNIVKLSII